jgi:hypothetical protein
MGTKTKTTKLPTCHYGNFNTYTEDTASPGLYYTIRTYLGQYADYFDAVAITNNYRATINKHLPNGVTLNGDDLIGPHPFNYELTYTITDAFNAAQLELPGICHQHYRTPENDTP